MASVALLMAVPEKKDRYLLPVLIPLCQLMGAYLAGLLRDPERGDRFGQPWIMAQTAVFSLAAIGLPLALWWLRPRFPALGGLELAGMSAIGALFAALLYRLFRARNLPALFAAKFSLLGLCCLALPYVLQPPPGDMSVPLAEIRALTSDSPVLGDSSLKFQDAWIAGRKPMPPEAVAASGYPEAVCFLSRRKNPQPPEDLREYVPEVHLKVSDLSGQTLHVIALRRSLGGSPQTTNALPGAGE